MIPKIIHYCWFGGKPLPKLAERCIESWKRFLPDYEIKRWDESNFEVNIIPYTSKAYALKKYAFVSDYARFWILNKYGGLYFDTDVELIKPIDDIIKNGPFMGCETGLFSSPCKVKVNPGLGLGLTTGMEIISRLISHYDSLTFELPDGKSDPETIVTITTKILKDSGLKDCGDIQNIAGLFIYPSDYFCPISVADGKLRITPNTRSIHWYDQSWQSPIRKYGRRLILTLGGVRLKTVIKKFLFK